MIAVFDAWYDDQNPDDRRRALIGTEVVLERLARAGIAAALEDDPAWRDDEGEYVLGPSGRFRVTVIEWDEARSRRLLERCGAV